jgi:hypothetical protein
MGMVNNIRRNSELVRLIVHMREIRDGMVETPEQFYFVQNALALRDTRECAFLCRLERTSDKAALVLHHLLTGWIKPIHKHTVDTVKSSQYITFTTSQMQRVLFSYVLSNLDILGLTSLCALMLAIFLFGVWIGRCCARVS